MYLENEDDEIHSEMETDNVSSAEYLDVDLLDIDCDDKENHVSNSRIVSNVDTNRTMDVPVCILNSIYRVSHKKLYLVLECCSIPKF